MTDEQNTEAMTIKEDACPLIFDKDAPTGYDDVPTDDLPIPRLFLLQGKHPFLKQHEGFKEGDFVNSTKLVKYNLGTEFVFLDTQRGALYKQDSIFVCRSDDGITNFRGEPCRPCPHAAHYDDWKDGQAPGCTRTIEFLAIRRDTIGSNTPDIMMVSFAKTALQQGKNVLGSVAGKGQKKIPLYSKVWAMETQDMKNKRGQEYLAFKPVGAGWVTQDELGILEIMAKDAYKSKHNRIVALSEDEIVNDNQNTNEGAQSDPFDVGVETNDDTDFD